MSQPEKSVQKFSDPSVADTGIADALPVLAHFLRLRALGDEQKATNFIVDEIAKAGAGGTSHIEAITGLEKVFTGTRPQSRIELGPCLERVCGAIRPAVKGDGSLHLNCEFERGCEVETEAATPIALIVCELVLNAAKYAHPACVPGRIDVVCRRYGRDLLVDVSDDGVGLPTGFDPASDGRLGLEMVRALAQKLGGQLDFQSDELGLRVVLRLKN